ncbi:MAG: lipoyl synthase [Acidimicrobiales bacterium]
MTDTAITGASTGHAFRVRWLGRVPYAEAADLQRALRDSRAGDYLLLLEHPSVYTLGVRTKPEHVLPSAAGSGAEILQADRGGDVTYHGPGQLVGYPVMDVPMGPGAIPSFVHAIEQLVVDVLGRLGLPNTGRLDGYPGVWVDPVSDNPRKICAIGVRIERGRSMHGFALNVNPDMAMFGHIVPCGLAGKPVTSLAAEGAAASMRDVVEAVSSLAPTALACGSPWRGAEVQHAAWRLAPPPLAPRGDGPGSGAGTDSQRGLDKRLAAAGVDAASAITFHARKPSYLRAPVQIGAEVLRLRSMLRDLKLVTVCEEAGCPNLSECWSDGTATFMINGERCTRACGFCLVDTLHPLAVDPGEPAHVAEAVSALGLAHAVVTAVARDDLSDGGAAGFAATVEAIRAACPGTAVELLIPDCKGDLASLRQIFDSRPDVLNHNIETVLRLQRAVRPSASYARSLAVLARAKSAGLVTKSGLILGMGETLPEVLGTIADLRAVGVDIITIGQYLRPSERHLPVVRWWTPEEFRDLAEAARAMGVPHVEASPLTRSSYHARRAADGARAAMRADERQGDNRQADGRQGDNRQADDDTRASELAVAT